MIIKNFARLKTIVFAGLLLIAGCTNNNEPTTQAEKNQPKAPAPAAPVIPDGSLTFGKYGCTSSVYTSDGIEYQGRGFITLSASGTYSYEGFKEPSKGQYTVDEKGNLHFKSGYLDGGEATKIDRPNKFFLVFPTIPDNRWTMGLVE